MPEHSDEVKPTDAVDPREAARLLPHLLSGGDIGVVMSTEATFGVSDVSRKTHSVAVFRIECTDFYFGRFLESCVRDVKLMKSGCRWLTHSEVEALKEQVPATG